METILDLFLSPTCLKFFPSGTSPSRHKAAGLWIYVLYTNALSNAVSGFPVSEVNVDTRLADKDRTQ
jgi:hypothetical protein